MKTKEELNAIKEEVEAVNEKLAELTPEEIAQVNGGRGPVGGLRAFEPNAREPVAPDRVIVTQPVIESDAAIQPGISIDR